MCFCHQDTKMFALASSWLRHFRLLLCNHWTELDEAWQEARSLTSSTKFKLGFFLPIGKPRWPPWHLNSWDILDFFRFAKRNSTKLDRKQDLNVLYHVYFFGEIGKQWWLLYPLIGRDIFDFFSKSMNGIYQNLTGRNLTSSTQFLIFFFFFFFFFFFLLIGKPRLLHWPLIFWHIFDFFSDTAERNLSKLSQRPVASLSFWANP